MTGFRQIGRRGFLSLALGVSGSAVVGAMPAVASVKRQAGVLVYDAAIPAARRFAASSRADFAAIHPIKGDRVRFARALAAQQPSVLSGLTRYGDFLLISGTAEETGYRLVAQTSRPAKGGALIAWTMRRR